MNKYIFTQKIQNFHTTLAKSLQEIHQENPQNKEKYTQRKYYKIPFITYPRVKSAKAYKRIIKQITNFTRKLCKYY